MLCRSGQRDDDNPRRNVGVDGCPDARQSDDDNHRVPDCDAASANASGLSIQQMPIPERVTRLECHVAEAITLNSTAT